MLLTADDVSHDYSGRTALAGVRLSLGRGVTALVGPNGAGKSTLMRLLTAVEKPKGGDVCYRGRSLQSPQARRELRNVLGYLPQDPDWHRWMTLGDIVGTFAWLRHVPKNERLQRIRETLKFVGLVDRVESRASTLSGGEFQRLMLATALVHQPQVLVLDEPTVGLDPEQRLRFREILRDFSTEGSVLLSTHLLDDVAMSADRLVVLDQGRIIYDGTVDELTSRGLHKPRAAMASDLEAAYLDLLRGRE